MPGIAAGILSLVLAAAIGMHMPSPSPGFAYLAAVLAFSVTLVAAFVIPLATTIRRKNHGR